MSLARDPERAGERLEDGFNLVMARSAVHHLHVDIRAGANREPFEEIVHELGLQIAHAPRGDFQIHHRVGPAAEIHGGHGKGFVHRHHEVAGAIDAAAVAERLRHGLAEGDAEIFHGVMLIDIEIARRRDVQIEPAVPREELEHVIQEADAGADAVLSLSIEPQCQRDGGLGRPAVDQRAAHNTSSITASACRV